MSKWNKQSPQLSEEFLQNEERRKQMIIEAARRRKEQEKKQVQIQEKERKDSQQALSKHKEQKKDAYIRYLRSNMHDQHQQKQRKQKQNQEIHSNAKWKKKSPPKAQPQQLQALDLEVQFKSDVSKQEKKKITEEFEKQWMVEEFQQDWKQKQQEELIGSQLLDSLDLDMGTVSRQKQLKSMMKKQDEEKSKWPSPGTEQFQDHLKKLKEMIGYESNLFDQQSQKTEKIKGEESKSAVKRKIRKETNEVQAFNELKNKKEAKIMNWAQEDQEEADQLFSNCSSRKKIVPALKEVNEELRQRKTENNLPTIEEEKQMQHPVPQVIPKKERSTEVAKTEKGWRQKSVQKPSSRISNQHIAERRPQNSKQRSKEEKKRSNSHNKVKPAPQTMTSFGTRVQKEKRRQSSKEKRQGSEQGQRVKGVVSKTTDPARKTTPNLPPLPYRPQSNHSNATYDIQIDVESFIKQDLISLNENERKLQEELMNIHKNHKADIKEMFEKYDIRTDYKRSAEIVGEESQLNSYAYRPTEERIEQSIQNLDNLLIRREILDKERDHAIREETLEEENSKSLINPFSNSDALCQQVLQLAKNVSRFQAKVEEPTPNGYLSKVRKNNSVQKHKSREKEKERVEEKLMEVGVQQSLCESQQVSNAEPLRNPPSLQEPRQKIHVNRQLLRGLLDEDDLE